jgi:SAM-dependent methyltransferase
MIANEKIATWERVEVERSASEAGKKATDDLRIADAILARYQNALPGTPFPLEYAYALLPQDMQGLTVLDYGCGSGDNTVLLAQRGGNVIGVDISPDLISVGEKRLAAHDMTADLRVGSAHDLPLEANSVDVVFGMAILHHLDLELAAREVQRVLKPGGRAIFLEPVRNSKAVWFIRNLIPWQQPDLSPYERPLTDKELRNFANGFSGYHSRAFHFPVVNLLEVLRVPEPLLFAAIRIDGALLKLLPFLQYYASIRVVEMTK